MLKCHAALGPLANMPALERLMPPSGCLDLLAMAALWRHEALSGRAHLPVSLQQPWHFVPVLPSLRVKLESSLSSCLTSPHDPLFASSPPSSPHSSIRAWGTNIRFAEQKMAIHLHHKLLLEHVINILGSKHTYGDSENIFFLPDICHMIFLKYTSFHM